MNYLPTVLDSRRGVLPSGTTLNGIYELESLIATGGMGEVYRARVIQTGDLIAIKMIRWELAADELFSTLFKKEAAALFKLQHDAVVRYFISATDPVLNRPYLSMEYIEGYSLTSALKKGPLSSVEVLTLMERLAAGLSRAHDLGIVHRDVAPDNVYLPDGQAARAKIIDFGIARSAFGGDSVIGPGFAGKLNFVSPEQVGLFNGEITPRSDIYSLGLTLAAAAAGRAIDMGGTHVSMVQKRQVPPDLSALPNELRSVLMPLLAPDPKDRPASMTVVMAMARAALDALASGPAKRMGDRAERQPAPRRRRWIAAAVAVVILAGGGAATLYGRRGDAIWSEPSARRAAPPLSAAPSAPDQPAGAAAPQAHGAALPRPAEPTNAGPPRATASAVDPEPPPAPASDAAPRSAEPPATPPPDRGDANPVHRDPVAAEPGPPQASQPPAPVQAPAQAPAPAAASGPPPPQPAPAADRASGAAEPASSPEAAAAVATPPVPAPPPAATAASASLAPLDGPPVPGKAFQDCPTCPRMVVVAPGSFKMGSNSDPTEKPVRKVSLKGFAIGVAPVTVAEWNRCVADKACQPGPTGQPASFAHNLSFDDAVDYVTWLSRVTGRRYRLPSEAEWEYAARGGTTTRYWWGEQFRADLSPCRNCGRLLDQPPDLPRFQPNPFGLYAVTGAVAQWTADCWHSSYVKAPADGSAWTAPACHEHVLRGGLWNSDVESLRISNRDFYDSGVRYPGHGFRVARDL